MSEKIKVAHVIRVFSYGGAEISLKELLAAEPFKENCISDLHILDHKKLDLVNEVKANTRNIYHYRIVSVLFLFEYIRFIAKIIANKYHIVHMHLPVAGWMGIIAKLFCPLTKFVYTEHSLVSFYKKYNYYLSGLTYGFNDAVISVSEEVSSEISRQQTNLFFKRKNAVTISNGVNTYKFFPGFQKEKEPKQLVVGLVARFRQHKRLDRWIEVANEINKRTKNIKFLIVGDGPQDNYLRKKIAEKKLQNIIQLAGKTHDTVNSYRQIDVFLLTSDLEGLPLSLMEAMSCGCVPAVNNVGGIKQLNFNNTGFKFDEFTAVVIAEKIIEYIKEPGKLFLESENARAYAVQTYSLNKQAKEIIYLYRELAVSQKPVAGILEKA
jgi:glycosyltransferase involved in cell wall biosynthesis